MTKITLSINFFFLFIFLSPSCLSSLPLLSLHFFPPYLLSLFSLAFSINQEAIAFFFSLSLFYIFYFLFSISIMKSASFFSLLLLSSLGINPQFFSSEANPRFLLSTRKSNFFLFLLCPSSLRTSMPCNPIQL